MEVAKFERNGGGNVRIDRDIWNIKLRLLVGGPILIVLVLILYLARGTELTLVLPVIGVVLLIAGVLYKPRQNKTKNAPNTSP